jgi:hypothetical protein
MEPDIKITLELLKDDLEYYNEMLKEVSADILKEGFSKYPIFIAHQDEIKLGDLLLDGSEHQRSFNISATVLEDLLERNIVTKSKEEEFKLAYKNPNQFMCVLLVANNNAQFIFVPYKQKSNNVKSTNE